MQVFHVPSVCNAPIKVIQLKSGTTLGMRQWKQSSRNTVKKLWHTFTMTCSQTDKKTEINDMIIWQHIQPLCNSFAWQKKTHQTTVFTIQPSMAAVKVTLVAFAADRSAVVATLLLGAGCAAIIWSVACWAHSSTANPLHTTAVVNSWDRQMERWMDRHRSITQTLLHTLQTVPIMVVNKKNCGTLTSDGDGDSLTDGLADAVVCSTNVQSGSTSLYIVQHQRAAFLKLTTAVQWLLVLRQITDNRRATEMVFLLVLDPLPNGKNGQQKIGQPENSATKNDRNAGSVTGGIACISGTSTQTVRSPSGAAERL